MLGSRFDSRQGVSSFWGESDFEIVGVPDWNYYSIMESGTSQFRFEREMLGPLLSALPAVFHLESGQRWKVLREVAIGPVIPDVLFGIWSGDLPRLNGLNVASRHILALLSAHGSVPHEESLCEQLLLSRCAASAAVATLKRAGAITQQDSGEFRICPEFDVSRLIKLVAIEVKLSRWREALAQAVTYREFVDEAYVVLDGGQVRMSVEIRAAFTANGIGLFLQNGCVAKREIIAARVARRVPSVDRLFAVAKLAKSGPHCLA